MARIVLGIVNPKEIKIENCLDDACKPGYPIDMSFRKVPVQPVGNVQRSVGSKRKEVMSGNCFRFTSPL